MRLPSYFFSLALVLAALSSGCGTSEAPQRCSPESCAGCCDANDVCQLGNTQSICGTGGGACAQCQSDALCTEGACLVPPVDAGTPLCSATPLDCADSTILNLDLKPDSSPKFIQNAAEGAGWRSTVDTTAGGFQPTESYVYAKFTGTGLEKVAIDDLQALEAMDWDIAFRRFIIRLNGGDSGPSCTGAVTLPGGASYEELTAEPSGAVYQYDGFFTAAPTCTFVPDASGLETSPNAALSSFYDYPSSCVAMTGRVYVLRTRAQRVLKLTVTTYYQTEAGQTACNTSGSSGGVLGGTVRLRWQFLN